MSGELLLALSGMLAFFACIYFVRMDVKPDAQRVRMDDPFWEELRRKANIKEIDVPPRKREVNLGVVRLEWDEETKTYRRVN